MSMAAGDKQLSVYMAGMVITLPLGVHVVFSAESFVYWPTGLYHLPPALLSALIMCFMFSSSVPPTKQ